MRITIDIDAELIDKVVKTTGEKTKSKAVNEALRRYLRSKAYEELLALAGTMEFDEDWDIWRRTDLGRLREFEIDEHSSVRPRSG